MEADLKQAIARLQMVNYVKVHCPALFSTALNTDNIQPLPPHHNIVLPYTVGHCTVLNFKGIHGKLYKIELQIAQKC